MLPLNMEKKELIGRKVKGFAFSGAHNGLVFNEYMDVHIGEVGVIIGYVNDYYAYKVEFEDGEKWNYPASLIEQHLVTEAKIDMELLDKFAMAALPGLVERLSIHITAEQAAKLTYQLAKAMIEERINYEDDVILGKDEV